MARIAVKKHRAWYESARPKYQALGSLVATTIRALLEGAGVPVVDVSHRAKTLNSFEEKLLRKRYTEPKIEMTDLAGVRVITLIERDVDRVSGLVRESFGVHANASVDKSETLGSDRFGYRSVHFVCDVGEVRRALPEFSTYAGMPFEIQIRTALQHAWAEIEHDRSYKFAGELPSKLKRRFHLIAGLLELADREFNSLTQELESYAVDVHDQAQAGNLEIELNSTSATEFLKLVIAPFAERLRIDGEELTGLDASVLAELRRFGVDTVSKLSALLDDQFFTAVSSGDVVTGAGLVRDAMMYRDIDRYFALAWQDSWQGWESESVAMLERKYGQAKISGIIRERRLEVLSSDDYLADPD